MLDDEIRRVNEERERMARARARQQSEDERRVFECQNLLGDFIVRIARLRPAIPAGRLHLHENWRGKPSHRQWESVGRGWAPKTRNKSYAVLNDGRLWQSVGVYNEPWTSADWSIDRFKTKRLTIPLRGIPTTPIIWLGSQFDLTKGWGKGLDGDPYRESMVWPDHLGRVLAEWILSETP